LAATLVLGIAIGQVAPLSDGGPIRDKEGVLFASGDLSRVLDSRLASQQGAGEETRVGISFARSDGGVCRTFQSPAIEGLACREGDGWRMVMIGEGGAQTSEYRMAGSSSAAILAAAQEMMTGEPLDAEAERRARDAGWRISAPAD
jgi:hypothetical protein